MLLDSSTPTLPPQPIMPIECYDENGYSKTKAFLYKVAYTPSFSLPSNGQSLRILRVVQSILAGVSLLTILSIPPFSQYTNKLIPLVSKIMPAEWVKNVLKRAVGIPVAIVFFAVASVYTLLMQKKCRIVLGSVIAVKLLAFFYLQLSKPTAKEYIDHLQKIVNPIATPATIEPNQLSFGMLRQIREVNGTKDHAFTAECTSMFLKELIALMNPQTATKTYVEKIQDILTYVTIQLEKDRFHLKFKLLSLRAACAAHIYACTKNPVLSLSLLQDKENVDSDRLQDEENVDIDLLQDEESVDTDLNLKSAKYSRTLYKQYRYYSFIFKHAQLQLEECRSNALNREASVLSCIQSSRIEQQAMDKNIATLITQYIGHEFIETLFIHDALSMAQDESLLKLVRVFHGTPDETTLNQFSEFLTKECFFKNPERLRIAVDAKTRPLDWSEATLKARLEVLDGTVLDA